MGVLFFFFLQANGGLTYNLLSALLEVGVGAEEEELRCSVYSLYWYKCFTGTNVLEVGVGAGEEELRCSVYSLY